VSKKSESELPQTTVAAGISSSPKKDTVKIPDQSGKQTGDRNIQALQKPRSEKRMARLEPVEVSTFSMLGDLLPKTVERNDGLSSSAVAEKYMIYSDGDGNAIRLPKKIFNAIACPTDNIDCKQHLKRLQEKFASSAFTTDFSGLIEILKKLQENQ
jgi:hypothetical protein